MESNRSDSPSPLRAKMAGIGEGLAERVIAEIDKHKKTPIPRDNPLVENEAKVTKLVIDVFSTVSNTAKLALFANKDFRQFTADVSGSGYTWAIRCMAKGLLAVLAKATHEQLTGAARLLRQLADTADAIVRDETSQPEGVAPSAISD